MSARIFIGAGIEVIPQADFSAQKIDNNAGWQAQQSFQIIKGKLDDPIVRQYFGINKSITELDPNSANVWSFLRVRDISPQVIPGGWEIVVVNFGGIPSVDSAGNPITDPSEFAVSYSMRGQVSDASFQDHPKWKALSADERNALGKIASGVYLYGPDFGTPPQPYITFKSEGGEVFTPLVPDPIVSNDAKDFAIRLAEGRNSYRAGGITWAKRWASLQRLTSQQINLLGKIATPPGAPPTPSTRNWMLSYAAFDQTGEENANPQYTNEVIFELSEPGGWDAFLQS